jgi:hypothetical protein
MHGQCPVCQHYGSDCTGTDEEEPTPEEQRTVAQLTRKPRLQQLAERLVVVEMTKADTRAVQQLAHGLAALMEKVNALMPPDVQGTIRQIDKAMNAEVYERLALEQRVVNHEDRSASTLCRRRWSSACCHRCRRRCGSWKMPSAAPVSR